ncbi:MAG: hypothetical protein HYV94_13435 [Candidatus Rokubacteria bacterium]|nr:hypothetical protein [Candidatus Rokubacteria bacterium]MBI4629400.1 hypothetical protein [Candidatus Rokubacteria bacterium]
MPRVRSGEDLGGEAVELLRELRRATERLELPVRGAGLRAAGDRGAAQRGILEHPERRAERLTGGRVEGLGAGRRRGRKRQAGQQDERRGDNPHASIDHVSRRL